MYKDDQTRVKHMLDAASEILAFSRNKTRADLDDDRKLSLSLVHLLEILDEAASGVSEEFQEVHPEIPWNYIIGMRNRLIHGYFDIDLDIVWRTVQDDIPPLNAKLKKIVNNQRRHF